MRTLRLSLVGIVTLSLVGGFALTTLAQATSDEAVRAPTEFSGWMDCPYYWHDGKVTNVVLGPVGEGNLVRRETRGQFWRDSMDEMSDPRFSGTVWAYFEMDEYVYPGADTENHPEFVTGVMRIQNDAGAWQGPFGGAYWPAGPFQEPAWYPQRLTGEGAYEGLTAVWGMLFAEDPCGWDIEGIVFEGEMPAPPVVVE